MKVDEATARKLKMPPIHYPAPYGWTTSYGEVEVKNVALNKLCHSGYGKGNKADAKKVNKIAKKTDLLVNEIAERTGERVKIIIE